MKSAPLVRQTAAKGKVVQALVVAPVIVPLDKQVSAVPEHQAWAPLHRSPLLGAALSNFGASRLSIPEQKG